jgi:hypothetical protein
MMMIFAMLLIGTLADFRQYSYMNGSSIHVDFGENRTAFSIAVGPVESITVGPQNITFLGPTNTKKFNLEDDSRVSIHNRTSIGHLGVSKNSHIKFENCDLDIDDDAHINGTMEFDGHMKVRNSTLVFARGAKFINRGTLELLNNSHIHAFELNLTTDTTILGGSITVDGTLQVSGQVNITSVVVADAVLLAPESLLTVSDVTTQSVVQVSENATLSLSKGGNFLLNQTIFQAPRGRRRLLQNSGVGNCVFNNAAILRGSGVLDCNVVFDGHVEPDILEVASATFTTQSMVYMETTDMIISQNDVALNGILQLDVSMVSESINFTVMSSLYGTITGQFIYVIFGGCPIGFKHTVVYQEDSVKILMIQDGQAASEPIGPVSELDANPIIIGVILGVAGLVAIAVIIHIRRKRVQLIEYMTTKSDVEHGYVNPLVKN